MKKKLFYNIKDRVREWLSTGFLVLTCSLSSVAQHWPTDSINNTLDAVNTFLSQRKLNDAQGLFLQIEKNNTSVLDQNPNYHFTKARVLNLYHADHKGSIAAYDVAKSIFAKEKEWRKVAIIEGNMADVYTDIHEIDKAQEHLEAALAYFEQHQDDPAYTTVLGGLARIYLRHGNYLKAADIYTETLKLAEKSGDAYQIGRAYAQLGVAYDYANMLPQAKQYYQKAIEYRLEEIGRAHV